LLGEEIRLRSLMIDADRPVTQLHFGGGTPTFLSESQWQQLFDVINRHFSLITNGSQDYSVEIDPREISKSKLTLLTTMGINRVSIGVQDFDLSVQKAIHRIQPVEMVEELVNDCRELSIRSINFDLIYGLPFQTLDGFKETLNIVLRLQPERISVFNYAHLPERFPAQKRIPEENLPSAEMKLHILKMTIDTLIENGYVYIGMDHFAKPDDTLTIAQNEGKLQRNFQGYTTHADTDLIAFGVSAISNLSGVYIQNHTDLSLYQNSIENGQLPIMKGYISDNDDRIRHQVIMTLISQFRLSFQAIEQEFTIRFKEYFAVELAKLKQLELDGIIEILSQQEDTIIKVTDRGRLLIRCVCMVFDKHLNSVVKYSKVI